MAARAGEKVNIAPVYADETAADSEVNRFVIFGDSLTDTGRLKKRLKVFPAKPYWLGRFTNGPAWPEYLAMSTGLGVQNHSYGGASAAPQKPLPGANLYARIRDQGQFFVSGNIALQVDDYLERTLADGKVERADTTAFIFWAGANDYISKEPVTGLITTFLNSPEGESGYRKVVEQAIVSTQEHIRRLYTAGARRFVIINLPDLGNTPIVLQNTTYSPDYPVPNDVARKLELSRRLTDLTIEHNQQLETAVARLQSELIDAEIILVDSFHYFGYLTDSARGDGKQQFGHDLHALKVQLKHESDEKILQAPCYTGSYLGTLNAQKTVCPAPEKAIFWDIVHPSTLTHCWHARSVLDRLESAGWIGPQPDVKDYMVWCRNVVRRITSMSTGHFSTKLEDLRDFEPVE
ncbi:MAG: SGNH/GDSL hydrolase family protein [Halioglobus sp.]|nr:SGNH/GDSL hydrolase family protein [Halioglobus sp.]